MSYQVLARKWRPKSFATLVGQEHVVRALTHALEQQRLHHAYLFTGTRGVGKTTIARIMAKALNCETGITPTPCGTCSACVEIDSGRFVDLIEVDAATNTKVDEMRQLLENATYAPTRGRFKVYVIDEVHMLSNSAFNAMLKTLEEPPEHIKFILATTDPQKIPVTVLSRCLQFNLKQMPQSHHDTHLTRILEQEGVPCEPAALKHLAKAAAGSMRDALSLLDQAIAHGAGRVEEENVRDMLGTVGDDYLYGILDALAGGDVTALMNVAETMDARSLSFDSALQELATLFHRIALAQFAPQALADDGERQRLTPYASGAAAFDAEYLQLAYQIAIHGRDDLALAQAYYEDVINPLKAVNRELDQQAALLKVTVKERGVETELQRISLDMKKQGLPLDEAETAALRAKLQALRDLNAATQAQDALLANSVGQREAYVTQLNAINALLADPNSGFTQGDAAQTVTQMFPDLLAGTQTANDAMVASFQNMYDQIAMLREKNLISAETAAAAEARIALMYKETQLAGTKDFFANLATLSSSGNKRLAAIGKAAAVTQATIDGVLAVQKALAAPPGWPYNAPQVIAVGISAAANVAKIAGFSEGGYTGDMGTGKIAGVVHGLAPREEH